MSRTVTAALCAVCTSATLVVTAGAASASDRADARRLLTPIAGVERVLERDALDLGALGVAWAAGVGPCLNGGYARLEAAAAAQTITAGEQETFGWLLFGVAALDAAVELATPLDRELATAQRQYQRMRIEDRALRAGARAKARQLAALRALEDVDTCRFIEQWGAASFSLLELPPESQKLQLAGEAEARAVERASRRMRRLGIAQSRVDGFGVSPLFVVAAPALTGEIRPPVD